MIPRLCDCALERKKNTTTLCSITYFFFLPASLFFGCLKKQKQELTDDPILQLARVSTRASLYLFIIYYEYANEGASHSIVERVM